MKKIIKMSPYLIINFFVFYLSPLLIRDTGGGMFVLLMEIPVLCFIISLVYGIKNRFDFWYPLLTTLLFLPTIFIFYNESALIYVVWYGMDAVIGSLLGGTIVKLIFKEK